MAYVDLATQSAGQTASAAGWANVVKANFASMGPHLIVRKTADESVVSSIAYQDDDALLFNVPANEIWQIQLFLMATGLFDFSGRFTFPSGRIDGYTWARNAGTTTIEGYDLASGTSPSGVFNFRADSTTVPRFCHVTAVFANGGTGGNFTLQWAQGVSGATATILKANSTLWGVKLA